MERPLNPNDRDDLLAILLKLEYSATSPMARRVGKLHCPYCFALPGKLHDDLCKLNNYLILMLGGHWNYTFKVLIHEELKLVEWKGSHIGTCPNCSGDWVTGHKVECFYRLLT